jgi:glycosyltransferase involved in cell wall biosynthesis
LKILLMGPVPPPHGGVQTHLMAIRKFLEHKGVPCAVINITGNRKPEGDNFYFPKNAAGLLWRLIRVKSDVIHLHFGGNLSLRLLALTLVCCAHRRAKTVMTFHSGGYPQSPEGRAASPRTLRGFVLRRLDCVIGVNLELVDMFHRFGVSPKKTRCILPHAFPLNQSSDESSSWPMALQTFFQDHDPVLLTVGGLEPEYQIREQIDMLGPLLKQRPAAGLVIIGGGSLESEIRHHIKSKEYAEHVLLCGDVPHAATLEAIRKCDLLLRITLYDGDSIAVREALFVGTPVLATDTGMRPDGVSLVRDPSPESLSTSVIDCLLRLKPHPTRMDDAGETNLEAVLQVYTELSQTPGRILSSSTIAAE